MGNFITNDREKIDRLCDQFESEWIAGKRPLIRRFLEPSVVDQKELFRELFSIELEYLRSHGESNSADDCFSKYSEFEESISSVLAGQGECKVDTVGWDGVAPTPSVAGDLSKTDSASRTATLPNRLGRYRTIRTIGTGGFGAVLLAWDSRLERNVAIKIVRGELRGNQKAAELFQRESRTIADLKHPNIVDVYDSGMTDDGDIYFVMPYFERGDFRQLISDHNLSSRELVRRFAELAAGLAVAHGREVFHRDIKPSNILVHADGRLCLVDFGLATHRGFQIEENLTAGTPEYMSPEQAAGEKVDARSDIFSLGVVLYEAVEGQRPYKSVAGDRKVDFDSRSLKFKTAAGPIESVCRRMLAIDPNERPSTALKVANRLNDAISTKWWKATVAAVLVATLLAAAVTGFVRWRAVHKERQLSAQYAELADLLVDVLRSADPSIDGREVTVASRLAEARERINGSLANSPIRAAAVLSAIGRTFAGLGMPNEALDTLSEAESLMQAHVPKDDRSLLGIQGHLADANLSLGNVEEAISELQQIQATWESKNGTQTEEYRFVCRSLTDAYQNNSQFPEALVQARHVQAITRSARTATPSELIDAECDFAQALIDTDDPNGAIAAMEQAAENLEKSGQDLPLKEIKIYACLAAAQRAAGVPSVEARQRALELSKQRLGDRHPDTLERMQGLAFSYLSVPDSYEKAKQILKERFEIASEVFGPDNRNTIRSEADWGISLYVCGDNEDAMAVLEKCVPRLEQACGCGSIQTLSAKRMLARAYIASHDYEKSAQILTELLSDAEETHGVNSRKLHRIQCSLISCYQFTDPAKAAELADQLYFQTAKQFGEHDAATVNFESLAADAYFGTRNYQQAVTTGTRFLSKIQQRPDLKQLTINEARIYTADGLFHLGDEEAALTHLQELPEPTTDEEPGYMASYALALKAAIKLKQSDIQEAKELITSATDTFPSMEMWDDHPWFSVLGNQITDWNDEIDEAFMVVHRETAKTTQTNN